jgi:hypothetical protein
MPTLNLLFKREYAINDNIHIKIPTVAEILEDEDSYYSIVSLLTAMPIDMLLWLEEVGIDFTSINDYELFLYIFPSIMTMDTSLVFGDLDLTKFVLDQSPQNGLPILIDRSKNIVIDRAVHGQIAATLRKIHHLKKNRRKPANEEAKQYMLQRAKQKARRRKTRTEASQLESLIVAMVNTEQYKYDYETTGNLTIYQFNESVKQIVKKVDYEHRMAGIYAGTIDPKGMSQDDLNWLVHK